MSRVPLAEHQAVAWLAVELWQLSRDLSGDSLAEEIEGRLRGWLADRHATGLDAVPEVTPCRD